MVNILIVVVGRDSGIKQLKGEGRPVNPQNNRLYLVAALESVDYAVLGSDTVLPGKIDWQTRMNVRGPNETAVSKSDGDFSIDLAFSKELFKDKATLTLNIRDLLDQRGWRNETFNENFYNNYEFRWGQRSATLNFTYRFNQKKNQNRRQMRNVGFDEGGFGS